MTHHIFRMERDLHQDPELIPLLKPDIYEVFNFKGATERRVGQSLGKSAIGPTPRSCGEE
jgi:hypothetical protein